MVVLFIFIFAHGSYYYYLQLLQFPACVFPNMFLICLQILAYILCLKFYSCNLYKQPKGGDYNIFILWVFKVWLGWKSFKVYHIGWKGPSPYYNPSLPYILIFIKNNESKVVKIFRRTIFLTITILNFIIIIHKFAFTWWKRF
jgi:hypothetical protein